MQEGLIWDILLFGASFEQILGLFAQDVDGKRMRLETMRRFVGTMVTNDTNVAYQNESFIVTGGSHPICRQVPFFGLQRFQDYFAWAVDPLISEYAGQHVVDGKVCALWRLKNKSMSLCADGNIPVELNISGVVPMGSGGSEKKFNTSYRFGPLKLGREVPEFLFQVPAVCRSLAPSCENARGQDPVVLNAYVFHPGLSAADYNIEDQNVADLAGDALFICQDCLGNQSSVGDHNYSLISRYTLEVSPAYGQYAMCNGYPDTKPPGPLCIGGDLRLVGKMAPFMAGDGEHRCSAGSPTGFWYHLPKAGRCSGESRPTKDAWAKGCTWSVLKRVKTIRQKCLVKERDFLKYCKADVLEKLGAKAWDELFFFFVAFLNSKRF